MKQSNPNQKVELCASKDATRLHLSGVHLNVETKRLVATDGERLVIVPCEVSDGDVSGLLPVAALVEARKQDGQISANGAAVLSNGATFERPDATFPPYESILSPERGQAFTFGLNAQHLLDIAKALGADKGDYGKRRRPMITLTIDTNDALAPIHVGNHRDPESIGVLMPCRV